MTKMQNCTRRSTRRPLRLQFSLRTLLVVTTVAAPLLGAYARRTHRFEVTAWIEIKSVPNDSMSSPWWKHVERSQEERRNLFRSHLVLAKALSDPDVAQLSVIKAQRNPVLWLRKRLRLREFEDSDLYVLCLSCNEIDGESPQQMARFLTAIVDAYFDVLETPEAHAEMATRARQRCIAEIQAKEKQIEQLRKASSGSAPRPGQLGALEEDKRDLMAEAECHRRTVWFPGPENPGPPRVIVRVGPNIDRKKLFDP